MNKFQKLAQLNRDIELLENAGKIKAAEVLHQKFIKEAQYMPQMMPMMMMPQMMSMMPQMMARPTMPVARPAVTTVTTPAPVTQPAPVATPAPKPAPVPVGETAKPTPVAPPPPPPTPTPGGQPGAGGITYDIGKPKTESYGTPTNDARFDYYNSIIHQYYQIEDPKKRQQALDKLKKIIQDQFNQKKLDPRHKQIFDQMFAGG
jgi:hypothetical protein